MKAQVDQIRIAAMRVHDVFPVDHNPLLKSFPRDQEYREAPAAPLHVEPCQPKVCLRPGGRLEVQRHARILSRAHDAVRPFHVLHARNRVFDSLDATIRKGCTLVIAMENRARKQRLLPFEGRHLLIILIRDDASRRVSERQRVPVLVDFDLPVFFQEGKAIGYLLRRILALCIVAHVHQRQERLALIKPQYLVDQRPGT